MVYFNKKLGEWSSGMILRLGILNNLSNKFRRGPGFDSQFAPIFFWSLFPKFFYLSTQQMHRNCEKKKKRFFFQQNHMDLTLGNIYIRDFYS